MRQRAGPLSTRPIEHSYRGRRNVLSGRRSTFLPIYEIGLTHQIDAAHRVVGHEGGRGKCARLHGHTYTFEVKLFGPSLDETGFVADFGAVKALLNEWDHRTLLWSEDPLNVTEHPSPHNPGLHDGVIRLGFNPTAEALARDVALRLLDAFPTVVKAEVICKETAKSSARWVESRAYQVWI